MIYVKNKAYRTCNRNIENRSEKVLGYFRENNVWIAFDNTSLDMFVEEFKYEKDAIAWVHGFDNIFDKHVRTIRLFNNLVYVSDGNFIKIKTEDEKMHSAILKVEFINSVKSYWSKIIKYIETMIPIKMIK